MNSVESFIKRIKTYFKLSFMRGLNDSCFSHQINTSTVLVMISGLEINLWIYSPCLNLVAFVF